MTRTTNLRAARRAFTLVELLVVIAIIVTLLAMTMAGVQKVAERQRDRTTKEQVLRLQTSLDMEFENIVRKCADDRKDRRIPPQLVRYCDGNEDRAQAVWTAMNLRRHFPQTFGEALSDITVVIRDANGTPIDSVTLKHLTTFDALQGLPGGAPHEESGALLYIILTDKTVTGGGAMAASPDEMGAQRMATFGGQQLKTFADAWGNSIGFRRWDQGSEVQTPEYMGTTNPFNPNNHDPLDTRNLVLGWADSTKRADMNRILTFNGQNRVRTVYSPGKDKTTGTTDDTIGYRLRRHGN